MEGLCGHQCKRLCTRACHCQAGLARRLRLLQAQRAQRQLRRLVVGRAIEANIRRAAGSFEAFQRQLLKDNYRIARRG